MIPSRLPKVFDIAIGEAEDTLPRMAVGLSDHVWSLEEIVLMADSYMPKPTKRGPYKKEVIEAKMLACYSE